jgi:hypothetical protein
MILKLENASPLRLSSTLLRILEVEVLAEIGFGASSEGGFNYATCNDLSPGVYSMCFQGLHRCDDLRAVQKIIPPCVG